MVVAVVVALPTPPLPPVSETAMVNETKRLKILWGNFRGGSILLTQTSFSFPSMTFTKMLEMWFCGNIYKNIPPYRMMRVKDVMHVKGGKQKLSNMKSLVKQVRRAVGFRIDMIWLSKTCPQGR